MFWSKIAKVYDIFENLYNGKVFKETGVKVSEFINEGDKVLECACGTGEISINIAEKCSELIATDLSEEMMEQAKKKTVKFDNVNFEEADITSLKYEDDSFDKVVAGNVIHLLDNPEGALKELERVCRPGGKVIVPTYIGVSKGTNKMAIILLKKLGAKFTRGFDEESYREFFRNCGYENVEFHVVRGRMDCDVAVISA